MKPPHFPQKGIDQKQQFHGSSAERSNESEEFPQKCRDLETCQPKVMKLSTRQCSYIDRFIDAIKSPTPFLGPRFPGSFFFVTPVGGLKPSHGLPTNHLWSLGSSVEPTSLASATTHFGSPQLEPWNFKKRWEWIRNFHS